MNKTVNQKAWFFVIPVFVLVAFNAIIPLMTVVNYAFQETFGLDFDQLNSEFKDFLSLPIEQQLEIIPDI